MPTSRLLPCVAWVALGLASCTDARFVDCDGGRARVQAGELRCVDGPPRSDAGARDGGGVDARGPDAGGLLTEARDAPDCLFEATCGAFPRLDLSGGDEVVYEGVIDGLDHDYSLSCGDVVGPDRDHFLVRAPARAFVEIEVEVGFPTAFPLLLLSLDEFFLPLTQAASSTRARTVFLAPAPGSPGYPLRVQSVESATLCEGPVDFRGGPDFGYRLTARICDGCALVELGRLRGSDSRAVEVRLEEPGDHAAYRVLASGGVREVVLLDATCPGALEDACLPVIAPLNPGSRGDSASYGEFIAPPEPALLRDAGPDEERLFAVFDLNGLGAPGYVLQLEVR